MSRQGSPGDHQADGRRMRSVQDPRGEAGGGSANFRTVVASPGQQVFAIGQTDPELAAREKASQIRILEAEAEKLEGSAGRLRGVIARMKGEAPAEDPGLHHFG